MMGTLEVEVKVMQMTRSSVFTKLILGELAVVCWTVGTMFSINDGGSMLVHHGGDKKTMSTIYWLIGNFREKSAKHFMVCGAN